VWDLICEGHIRIAELPHVTLDHVDALARALISVGEWKVDNRKFIEAEAKKEADRNKFGI
jgi:hypothetical protein